ncbi:hypothetical protein MBCUT_18660 [Methanobrevibacter cuticularis]|uniref:DUF1611 domain-containing protein n=1 Tax=Methanobrevibacter cuticularis TaxID=47311 RepID=A0A166CV59_9EURY|nr:DUF1611 domain-containing protein [Methanobrevibacter cuticularis]KZX14895.1 hypothetical protein MBCUT_18660 [Methanobrevibacter cuticularis]
MYSISSVEELQSLNPFVVIGCGGGGEKFSNLERIETVGFIDDDTEKHGKSFCGSNVSSTLQEAIKDSDAKSVAIMLPIGAEGTALKYAVQAIDSGKNVVSSFRSLPINENISLLKLAKEKGVLIKEISPRLDLISEIFGVGPEKCSETLPKLFYKPKAPVVFVGGTSQECGKRTTTRLLGKEANRRGMAAVVISTDEMGLEQPSDINFRAGSLSAMDVPSAILGSMKYLEEKKNPDIIFVEGQSSLTEKGNPHPRGLSAAILIGAAPDATIVCHRPNHPYRNPRGIKEEITAIQSLEPTEVVGLSLNLRNDSDIKCENIEREFNLPTANVYDDGASKLLDSILDYLEEKNK